MLLVWVSVICTIIALLIGIVLMTKGGKLNNKYSTTIMFMRIFLQFIAIMLIFILYYKKL